MTTRVTTADFKAAMSTFAAGVTVITTVDASGKPWALTATAFSSVSKDPPMCLICVSHDADAYPALADAGRFVVNVLSRDQEALSLRFATKGIDKFAGVNWTPGEVTGCPVISEVLTVVECVVSQRIPAGDHDVFIANIERVSLLGTGDPLVYFRSGYCDVTRR